MKLSSALLARNTLYNLFGQALPVLVAVLCTPALLRGLGTDRFGILTLAWVVIGYFSLFDLGLGRALTQYVAERLGRDQHHDIGPVVRRSLIMITGLGVLGAIFVAAISPTLVRDILKVPEGLQAETVKAFYILALSIPFVISTAAIRGVLEGYQLFRLTNALRTPIGIFTYVGPLLVLPFAPNLVWVVAVLLFGRVVGWAAHLTLCVKRVPMFGPDADGDNPGDRSLKAVFRFGGWMTVSNIVGPLMVTMDRFLVGTLVSVAAVAYYATPSHAVSQLLIIPASLLGVMFPAFALMEAQDRTKNAVMFERVVKYMLVILFPIALVLMTLAFDGLKLWLGADFALHATPVLRWLTIGIFLNALAFVPLALLQGIGRPDITAKLHLFELPTYLALVWWLTKARGVEGAAIAFTLRVALDTIILFVLVRGRLAGGSGIVRRTALASGAAVLTLMLASQLNGLYTRATFLFFVLSAFCLAVWFIYFGVDERTLLLRSLRVAPSRNNG